MDVSNLKKVMFVLALVGISGCATPEQRSNTASLDYQAIVQNPDRTDADRKTDARRLPVQLLDFAAAKPGMRVLDIGSGDGYTTELLARAVGPQGKVYAQ